MVKAQEARIFVMGETQEKRDSSRILRAMVQSSSLRGLRSE
jgi:hypothetical protein